MSRIVYDASELEESFSDIVTDFENLQEHLDDFEDHLDNLEVFYEDQHSTEFDACLAYLKQLKEIIADCEIRFNRYNNRYGVDYDKYKDVQTSLKPYRSIWKKVMDKNNENNTKN